MAEVDFRKRPSNEDKTKESDCDFVESAKSGAVVSVTHDSGFESAEDTTPIRARTNSITAEESKCVETFESSFREGKGAQVEFGLKIKLYGTVYDYGTRGNETIQEMVIKMVNEVDHGHQPNINRMLFKTMSDDFHLNLGVPTGALKRDVEYECVFRGRSNINTTDFAGEYYASYFHDDWQMNYFDVKLESTPKVSYMQSINVEKLRVHFLPEDTLYEALNGDGRFEKMTTKGDLLIRQCDFVSVDGKDNVLLSVKAKDYAGQCFTLKKRNQINSVLPANVPPREMPGHVAFKVLPNVKGEPVTPIKPISGEASQGVFQPSASSTPAASSVQIRKLQTFKDLKLYLEEDLGLKLGQERGVKKEEKRKRKWDTFLKGHCANFALDFPHSFSFSDFKHVVKLEYCIGAVIAVNGSAVKKCVGTCLRIGKKFVLTNYHVFNEVTNFAGRLLRTSYVDFEYKGTEEGCKVNFIDIPLLFYSEDLDYAILELDTKYHLPPSFTDQGYCIAPPTRQLQAGENLTLIGHPNGMGKMVNMSCPIKPNEKVEEHLNLAIHVLKREEFEFHCQLVSQAVSDPNVAVYDVSDFFWGSSGSPGILVNEKLLSVLHCCGVLLNGKHVLEKGILMSSIVKDVIKILDGNDRYAYLTIDDIFGEGTEANFQPQPMDID